MSLSKKDYNMCLYNSLAPKAGDSPKNIKENIAEGERKKIGKLGDTNDLNNFIQIYPFDVIVISRGSDNKPDFSKILDFHKTTGQAKDTIVIMYSKKHFSPVNMISDTMMEVLAIMAKDFHNQQLRTHFPDNAYELEMEQAMENSMGNYYDNYESEMEQAMENSMKIQSKPKEDTSLDSVLATSLFEHEQFIQNQFWDDVALAQSLQ
ncbi:uncharacterized protein METZ01_LOCUS141568 [marine metagenome]|uniref:Uncharacterized protein n=1 Tax=marine metagenome TaxID=408172 RepID=A0A381ZHV6_9ZZZZ